ncbi:uncharacterized protein LOC144925603 [Branchiostoma floridae x Branchiostoma belcheri]
MRKIQVILVVLLGMVKGLAALSCLQCGTFTCPPLPSCQGDVTKDACGCCDVCAKIPGESCGGQWNISGTCSRGLTCVVDPNEHLGNQATGTCACPPDSSWNSCGTACPKTCEGRPFACAAVCVPRCECYPWYVLDNGNCIPEGLCSSSNGCNYDGQNYNDGDEWAVRDSPGLVCQCDGTQVVCYVVDCAPGYSHVIGSNGLWTCWQQQRCPTGYTGRGKHCYGFVETPVSFQDAERNCVQDGAILVRIDPKKMHVYKRLQRAASRTGSDVWIGLSDRVTEGTLTWSNGDPYKIKKSKRNKFWAKRAWGQNSEDKDCVYMSRSDKYRWRFGNCDDERSFICRFMG